VYELVGWGFEIVGLIIQGQAGGGESDFTVVVDLEEAVGGGVVACVLEAEVGGSGARVIGVSVCGEDGGDDVARYLIF